MLPSNVIKLIVTACGLSALLLVVGCSKKEEVKPDPIPPAAPTATTPAPVPPPVMTQPPAMETPPVAAPTYHTVVKGDTLYNIAKRYNYSVEELARWNKLSKPDDIKIGQKILVSPPSY